MAIEPNNDRDRQTHGTSRIDEVDGQTEKKTNWLPWVLAALGTLLLLFTLSRCNRNEAAVVNNTTEYNAADLNATDFNTTDVNTAAQ